MAPIHLLHLGDVVLNSLEGCELNLWSTTYSTLPMQSNLTTLEPFHIVEEMQPTRQRQTADAAIEAMNNMDPETFISLRSPECIRSLHPTSLKIPPSTNAQFAAQLTSLKPIFRNFSLTVTELVEDVDQRKICMWLLARADTAVGEYRNEYVWLMEFDESGEKIAGMKEFVDAGMARDFWPRLKGEMARRKAVEGKDLRTKSPESKNWMRATTGGLDVDG